MDETSPVSTVPPKKSNGGDMLFSLLGKLFIFLLIIGAIAFAGYYFGSRYLPGVANKLVPTVTPVPTPVNPTTTPIASSSPTISQTPTPSPTATPPTTQKISAGRKTDVFSAYTLTAPNSWTANHTSDSASDKLTLTKGQYTLTVSQAAGGGGSCLYPGDPAQEMAQSFTSFVEITGTYSTFRRGTSDNVNFTVCEKKTSGFAFPTSVGYITYAAPTSPQSAILAEMDAIVASITK